MIDKKFIEDNLKEVNEKDEYENLGDKLIIELFKNKSPSLEEIFLRIVVLDSLWSTNLKKHTKKKSLLKIAKEIMKVEKIIIDKLPQKNLLELDLDDKNSEIIKWCVNEIKNVAIIMECLFHVNICILLIKIYLFHGIVISRKH